MKTLVDVYDAMINMRERYVNYVDDPEEMHTEITKFLEEAIPVIRGKVQSDLAMQEQFIHGPDGQCGCWPACQRGKND